MLSNEVEKSGFGAYADRVENPARLTFRVDLPGGDDRLRQMILYVATRCQSATRFGKVKLNKILWRADFAAFRERRVPITGVGYQKLAAGPAPLAMDEVLAEMLEDNLIDFKEVGAGDDYVEHRIIPLSAAKLSIFNPEDILFVDKSIEYYWNKSASSASDLSHRVAWKSRGFLERMPYESTFLSDDKLTKKQKEKFFALAEERGWKSL